jgi:hypothetical protein
MRQEKYKKNFTEMKFSNKWLIASNVGLTAILGVSLALNATSNETVIQKGNPFCEDLSISSTQMNEASNIRYSTLIANALGNITPKNAEFQRDLVLSYANASIYQSVSDIVGQQIAIIQQEQVSISFTAETAFYEDNKTFITGKFVEQGAAKRPIITIRTYEFEWKVRDYNPTFTSIDVYDEAAHDRKWRVKFLAEDKQ